MLDLKNRRHNGQPQKAVQARALDTTSGINDHSNQYNTSVVILQVPQQRRNFQPSFQGKTQVMAAVGGGEVTKVFISLQDLSAKISSLAKILLRRGRNLLPQCSSGHKTGFPVSLQPLQSVGREGGGLKSFILLYYDDYGLVGLQKKCSTATQYGTVRYVEDVGKSRSHPATDYLWGQFNENLEAACND